MRKDVKIISLTPSLIELEVLGEESATVSISSAETGYRELRDLYDLGDSFVAELEPGLPHGAPSIHWTFISPVISVREGG